MGPLFLAILLSLSPQDPAGDAVVQERYEHQFIAPEPPPAVVGQRQRDPWPPDQWWHLDSHCRFHVLPAGNTIALEALTLGVDPDHLADLNGLQADATFAVARPIVTRNTYRVLPGETLAFLARLHGTDVATLRRLNDLAEDAEPAPWSRVEVPALIGRERERIATVGVFVPACLRGDELPRGGPLDLGSFAVESRWIVDADTGVERMEPTGATVGVRPGAAPADLILWLDFLTGNGDAVLEWNDADDPEALARLRQLHLPPTRTTLALGELAVAGFRSIVQPREVRLGALRTGTRVQCDLLVYWKGVDPDPDQITVEAPAHARVLRSDGGVHANRGPWSQVWLEIDTATAGLIDEVLRLTCGERTVVVPIRARVLAADPDSPRILVADTPFHGNATDDPATFDAWRGIVAAAGLTVDYIEAKERGERMFREMDFADTDTLLLAECSLLRLTEEDLGLVRAFVGAGGRLVVVASSFFVGTVGAANRVLEGFPLRMHEGRRQGDGPLLQGRDLADQPLLAGVETIRADTGGPTDWEDGASVSPLVAFPGGGAFSAIHVTPGGGSVVTLGCPLWWHWVQKAPGNARFLQNLLEYRR